MAYRFDLRSRMIQVALAGKLARQNHIIQATARAVWSHLYKNGFTVTGPIDTETVQNVYVRLVRDAIRSLTGFGYFAIVIDGLIPRVLDPETYVVVDRMSLFEISEKAHDDPFHVIFLDQTDCDTYRTKKPILYIQFAPTSTGHLTAPAMQLIDMHDAIVEFTRLALLNDGINLRPKAWTSERETTKQPGVYRFLEEEDVSLPSGDARLTGLRHAKADRSNRASHVMNVNRSRASAFEEMTAAQLVEDRRLGVLRGPFATACLSRVMEMDSVHDPSLLVEVNPNMNVTQMAPTHTRTDLVDLIRLFDQRMCNALGVPPTLLGLPAPNNVSNHDDEAVLLWENTINPVLAILNMALADSLACSVVKVNAISYKKTRDRSYLAPVRIELTHALSLTTILTLEPFLTDLALNKHMALCTGLDVKDFRPKRIEEVLAVGGKK